MSKIDPKEAPSGTYAVEEQDLRSCTGCCFWSAYATEGLGTCTNRVLDNGTCTNRVLDNGTGCTFGSRKDKCAVIFKRKPCVILTGGRTIKPPPEVTHGNYWLQGRKEPVCNAPAEMMASEQFARLIRAIEWIRGDQV